jgi:prolipoprotein diacylglyceryltransferase
MPLASIPSPGRAAWHLGPLAVRGYALCVIAGMIGAVALGAAGAWIACRRCGVALGPVAGAVAPALAFGLAIGGLGNWWAQQFDGPPVTWWWAVPISPEHRVPGYENYATFQPAFLYQSFWEVALGFAVIWAARRLALTASAPSCCSRPDTRPAASALKGWSRCGQARCCTLSACVTARLETSSFSSSPCWACT